MSNVCWQTFDLRDVGQFFLSAKIFAKHSQNLSHLGDYKIFLGAILCCKINHKTLICLFCCEVRWVEKTQKLEFKNLPAMRSSKVNYISTSKTEAFTMVTSYPLLNKMSNFVMRRGPTCINHPCKNRIFLDLLHPLTKDLWPPIEFLWPSSTWKSLLTYAVQCHFFSTAAPFIDLPFKTALLEFKWVGCRDRQRSDQFISTFLRPPLTRKSLHSYFLKSILKKALLYHPFMHQRVWQLSHCLKRKMTLRMTKTISWHWSCR